MITMGYSDDSRKAGFAHYAQCAYTKNHKPFGLSYLDKEIHSDRRGINTSSRPAPLL